MSEIIIATNKVNRVFPVAGGEPLHVLKDITIEIYKSKLSILRGRSGSGKTTLINLLGALDQPTSGSIMLEGQDITKYSNHNQEKLRRSKFGFIFQSISLIPIMTVFENVEFSLRLSEYKESRKERVEECLKLVGLGNRMNHMPQELSGGEQQRVAIARAIAHKPAIIFADEPTAELDSNTSIVVMKMFKNLIEKEGVTIVMTTHDMGLMEAGDMIYTMEDGEIINE